MFLLFEIIVVKKIMHLKYFIILFVIRLICNKLWLLSSFQITPEHLEFPSVNLLASNLGGFCCLLWYWVPTGDILCMNSFSCACSVIRKWSRARARECLFTTHHPRPSEAFFSVPSEALKTLCPKNTVYGVAVYAAHSTLYYNWLWCYSTWSVFPNSIDSSWNRDYGWYCLLSVWDIPSYREKLIK